MRGRSRKVNGRVTQNEYGEVEGPRIVRPKLDSSFWCLRHKMVKCSSEMLRDRAIGQLEREHATGSFSTSRKTFQSGTIQQNVGRESV